MVIENISEKYAFCMATHKDIPELVRMRLKLQEHMEQVNNLYYGTRTIGKMGYPFYTKSC
jgi:hypothetical protein